MKVSTYGKADLLSIPPAALAAYARDLGWKKSEAYGKHSDVYIADGRPEIILPRTQRLADYANVVSQLIEIFSNATESGGVAVYHDLVTSDRDVIRVRAPSGQGAGSIAVNDGIGLINGAHDMLLAAACSLSNPQPLYRAGANKEASDYLDRVSLGQTEQGSFVITLLSPTIVPPLQVTYLSEQMVDVDPVERKITRRLAEALSAVRDATELTISGDEDAFSEAVPRGVSANLCEAIVQLIDPFSDVDISFAWARTYPRDTARQVVRFASGDAPVLRAASQSFREREPKQDVQLFGIVRTLTREQEETDGTITVKASVDDKVQSVVAVLNETDYHRAIQAHHEKSAIILRGDLDRFGQRWRLSNPHIAKVIERDDDPEEAG